MRGKDLLLAELRSEVSRRDLVRTAIVERFEVSGDARFVVRRSAVVEVVRRALGEDTAPPALCHLVADVVRAMGGTRIKVSQRRLFRGVRNRDVSIPQALMDSRILRNRDAGNRGQGGKRAETGAKDLTFETKLAAEGMPAQLPELQQVDHARVVLSVAAMDRAGFMAECLTLFREGLSVRRIAERLGLESGQKDRVHRALMLAGALEGNGKQVVRASRAGGGARWIDWKKKP